VQPFDFSFYPVYAYGRNPRKKYAMQHTTMMQEAILERQGDLDTVEWLVYGKHYAKNGDEETAFQAYYMAHLLDYARIGTNADLPFKTVDN
jgi:cytochrome c-type biogenesis protein CcmH/NrfG